MRRLFAFAIVILAVGFSLPTRSTSAPTAASPIAESWIAAWNSHDTAKMEPLFTSDIVYEDVAFGEINHGIPELKKFANQFFELAPDLKLELVNSAIEGNHGTIEWILSGTDKGIFKTQRKFKVRGVSVLTLDHGKISRNLDYYDAATIMKQVGLLPAS
ncbi:MAG: hypothetical protein NVS9B14_04600 [Candidatus Acidiferrum sp.]